MRVEVHIAGIVQPAEMTYLEERLRGMEGVEVERVEQTRVILRYDDREVDASDIQTQIEAAGGEVITLGPAGE